MNDWKAIMENADKESMFWDLMSDFSLDVHYLAVEVKKKLIESTEVELSDYENLMATVRAMYTTLEQFKPEMKILFES